MAAIASQCGEPIVRPYSVTAGQIVTRGYAVQQDADLTVRNMTAIGSLAIGIAQEAGVAGAVVGVALFGQGVTKGHVGAGGATRGQAAVYAAAGLDGKTPANGANLNFICGQFLESAAANELAAVNLGVCGPIVCA